MAWTADELGIVKKLKNSPVEVQDPRARRIFNELMANLKGYHLMSNQQYPGAPGLLNSFVEQFLGSFAYIGKEDGVHLPSYDPMIVAYSETKVKEDPPDGPSMPLHQWIAVWTNTWIIYSEYPEARQHNHFLMGIDNETYELVEKIGKLK